MSKTLSTVEAASATDTFALISTGLLVADPRNVRDDVGNVDDLANSIFQVGLQQPLRVRQVVLDEKNFGISAGATAFMVIAGHRRLAAIRVLEDRQQWAGDVPCMIASPDMSDDDITASMIVENLQRSDLNPIEEGKAFDRLLREFKYKRADLAVKISRSESYVGDRLALTKLPDCVQDSVAAGHYPMTAALLLKGVAPTIVETLTKGGRKIAAEHEIAHAVRSAKYSELKAAFEKALQTIGVEVVIANRYEFQNVSTEVASFTTLDDAKLLAKYEVPKGVKAVLNDSPYSGQISVELRKPMTAKQIEDAKAKRTEQYTAEQLARKQQQQERYEAERATWSPEYQAWVDECDALKAEHVAAVQQHEDASHAAIGAWASQVDAKLVAKWSMTDLINKLSWHAADAVIDAYDIPVVDNEDATDAIQTYVLGDAKALVRVVAYILGLDHDQAHEDQTAFLRKQQIPTVPELVLPTEPAKTKESPADVDPIDDVA
jgi:ParB/RepB/Spo0J family partition protein